MTNSSEVYFSKQPESIPDVLDRINVSDFSSKKVLVKLHVGEPGNKFFISPSFVKSIVDKLKHVGAMPFLFDTTVAYPGPRSKPRTHKKVAVKHGFGPGVMGCEVVIGEKGVKVVESGYTFEVAREVYESTHIVVVSHIKGHIQSGFGGAIKNLGMGGVTREDKQRIHLMCVPVLSPELCDLCGDCARACPFDAIKVGDDWRRNKSACMGCGKCVDVCARGALVYRVMDMHKALALSAKACIQGKRVLYINAVVNIARNCDCDPNAGPVICPDVGYLASNSMAAIDRASLDLVDEVKPGLFKKVLGVDPLRQIRSMEELGFSSEYELKKV